MKKLSVLACIACFPVCTAHADVLYTFALTSAQGNAGGMGSFSLNVPPPVSGDVGYAIANPQFQVGAPGYLITAFDLKIYDPLSSLGYDDFGINSFQNSPFVGAENGVTMVSGSVDLDGSFYSTMYFLTVQAGSYSYERFSQTSGGSIPNVYVDSGAVSTGIAVTPEPGGIILLGTGILGLALLSRKCQDTPDNPSKALFTV